jgi:hypothetical protein
MMHLKRQSLSRRLLLTAGVLFALTVPAFDQSSQYANARNLVERVQSDLRRGERFARPTDKERERYDNAQRHLSEFDRSLSRGKFDKDKLDKAIDDVNNVVEHNTLSPRERDALTEDLRSLRQLRATRGASY